MIFVTVGTSHVPFDRLIRALDGLGRLERLFVQRGASAVRPANAETVDFLSYDEVTEHMRSARVVVTHAGVGSIMAALAVGKRPIVVPRRKRFRETTDDHQVELARKLGERGMVIPVYDAESLAAVLGRRENESAQQVEPHDGRRLEGELRAYLNELVALRGEEAHP